jgi:hypothetical protein
MLMITTILRSPASFQRIKIVPLGNKESVLIVIESPESQGSISTRDACGSKAFNGMDSKLGKGNVIPHVVSASDPASHESTYGCLALSRSPLRYANVLGYIVHSDPYPQEAAGHPAKHNYVSSQGESSCATQAPPQ